MAEPLVSAVTPVYNTGDHLAECIESVLSQSYENLEHIIVNNCSDDDSGQIADEYATRDGRIRVIHSDTFRRQIENYNFTLRQISPESKYAMVVQADDWIFPQCIERQVAVAESSPRVGLVGSYRIFGRDLMCAGLPYEPSGVFPGDVPCRLWFLEQRNVFGSPTPMLFRSSIVRERDAFFDPESHMSDAEVCFDLLREWDYGFVFQVLGFSRFEEESLSSGIRAFSPTLPGFLFLLEFFGEAYLTPEELRVHKKLAWAAYERLLGESVIRRDAQFWAFHRRALERLGRPGLVGPVSMGLIRAAGHAVANPARSVRRIRSFLWSG